MESPPPAEHELEALSRLFAAGKVAVLTGAGISTESGIPDYRGPETQRRARNPVQYREFLRSDAARRRYWARSMFGWPRLSRARPNEGHAALARLEAAGRLTVLVTQNVDGLHGEAGSRELIELHGALRTVVCLACGERLARATLQDELERRNGALRDALFELAPDGDADLPDAFVAHFQLFSCVCGGPFKPDVVFFGENVPPPRVAAAFEVVARAASLLVVGSSLAVYSGLRFVRAAHARGVPIAIVSLGETRGDACATLRVNAGAGATLAALTERVL